MAYGAVTRNLVKQVAALMKRIEQMEDRIEQLEAAVAPLAQIANDVYGTLIDVDDPCERITVQVESGAVLYAQWVAMQRLDN